MSRYIDAEAYKAAHKNAYETAMMECGKGEDTKLARRVYEAVIKSVDVFPAADVQEVKHGRWRKERVSSTGSGSYGVYQCSICGAMFPDVGYGYNYCPNCGAKMDEDDNYCNDETCETYQRDLNCDRCQK